MVGFAGFQFVQNNGEKVENENPGVSPTVALDVNQDNAAKKSTKEAIAEAFGQKYNRPVSSFMIEVAKDTGLFAQGSVGFEGEMGGGI